jgi:hypothetical protein
LPEAGSVGFECDSSGIVDCRKGAELGEALARLVRDIGKGHGSRMGGVHCR